MTSDYDQKTPERAQHSSPTRSFPNKRGEWTGEAILSFLQRRLAESRVCRGVLLIVLVLAVLAQIQAARTRPFSYDELLTVYVSSLRTPSAIWEALGDGVDGMPFTYHWLTGQISLLSLDPHISFRLLSIAGYLMGMIGVYAFVGKRFGPTWGLVAALLLTLSPFDWFAHEARSYALLVGLLALATALWQRIEGGWWFTIAFAVCLGLAVASHHFAIVALGCFAAAELSAIFLHRGFRWRVWMSLTFSSVPFFLSLPLLLRFRIMYAAHYWSKPTWDKILSSYPYVVGLPKTYSAAFVVLVGIVAAGILLDRRSQTSKAQPIDGFGLPEIVLSIGFLLFPALLVILTMTQHAGYTERYAWPLILGFVSAFVFVFRTLAANSHSPLLVCALMIVFVVHNYRVWPTTQSARQFTQAAFAERLDGFNVVSARYRLEQNTPVVIASFFDYLTAVYYSDLPLSNRYYFLVDSQAAFRFTGTDSGDINMRAFSRAFPVRVRVEDANTFIGEHKKFIVWANNGDLNCWVPQFLIEKGVQLRLIQDPGQVYLVESK